MSEEIPDRPPQAGLVRALRVKRNVSVGAGVGVALAVGAYLARVLELFGPFAGTREYPVLGAEGWFLLLAFVLATSTALLVAAALTVREAVRLSREIADE
ncbi:DUF7536 family protein [Halobellus sp. GM3]|uniref:DUF7536 family protein n=1 Tax=Halobellus sp. GM3 TaxID=3458410 RepID=UPI00403E14C3